MRTARWYVALACLAVHVAAAAPDEKIACPTGYQPMGPRCVSQRMSDFIACVEATGGGKEAFRDEVTKSESANTGGKASGAGTGVIVSGKGALVVDRKTELAIAQRIEKKWFPGGLSECRAVLDSPSKEVKKSAVLPPKLVQFALDKSNSSFAQSFEPKFGAGPRVTTYAVDPAFAGILRSYRAIFSVSVENPNDSDLLITEARYNISEIGQVLGGSPGPLESNQTYFHKLKYTKGTQSFELVPPYKIPPKSVGAFSIELATDETAPGLAWLTNIAFLSNLGTVKTKTFQLILTGKNVKQ
jgi:hypothetical protein